MGCVAYFMLFLEESTSTCLRGITANAYTDHQNTIASYN